MEIIAGDDKNVYLVEGIFFPVEVVLDVAQTIELARPDNFVTLSLRITNLINTTITGLDRIEVDHIEDGTVEVKHRILLGTTPVLEKKFILKFSFRGQIMEKEVEIKGIVSGFQGDSMWASKKINVLKATADRAYRNSGFMKITTSVEISPKINPFFVEEAMNMALLTTTFPVITAANGRNILEDFHASLQIASSPRAEELQTDDDTIEIDTDDDDTGEMETDDSDDSGTDNPS